MSLQLETRPRRIEDPPIQPPRSRRPETRFSLFLIALVVLGVGALAALLLRGGTGDESGDAVALSQDEVVDILLRAGPGTDEIELELLYTPSWYFEWSGRDAPAAGGEPALAFFMFETIHDGELPSALPDVYLSDGAERLENTEATPVSTAPHHRVTQFIFPAELDGRSVISDPSRMRLTVTSDGGAENDFTWELPLPHGLGILNTATTQSPLVSPALSMGAILAIFGGMLTALSPCLLLLATYYSAVLSGTAASGATGESATKKVLTTGLFFVGGFTVIYTAGGVFAGYVGESVTRLDGVGQYARPASLVAGVAVVILGIRVASQARVPVACKIPGFNRPSQSGWVGSALMGSTFAFGCLSCFSATVLSALLLYAGATGSPLTGGLIMLVFSAGVGVMFLAAAWLVAQAAPLMSWLEKARPYIGGASATLMIFFGVLMITYKFHIVTGYLLRLWA